MLKRICLLLGLLISPAYGEDIKSVMDYGAKCDNQTDDFESLKRGLTEQKGLALKLPEGRICYTSRPLVMEGGSLWSAAGALQNPPGFNGSGGGVVRCGALGQGEACLTVAGGGSTAGSPLLRNVAVVGTGLPKKEQIGILVTSTYNAVLDGVMVYNQSIGIKGQAVGVEGISFKLHNVETCRIYETDLMIDSLPETRVNMFRFGCNGDTIIRSGGYITVQGSGPGPNTLNVTNSQFNAGAGGARCFVNFRKMKSDQYSGIVSEWTFIGNHFESGFSSESGICSDESVELIYRLKVQGNWFLNSGLENKFLNLNSNTTLWDSDFSGNHFVGWSGGFSLASNKPFYNLILNGNHFQNTPVYINGIWPSTILALGNLFEGITLRGSFYHEGAARIGGINNGPLVTSAMGIKMDF